MKKAEFTSKGYEYFLLVFFAYMVLKNSYACIIMNEYPISIPVILNLVVLLVVLSRINIVTVVLYLYAIIFLIGAPLIVILAKLVIGEEDILSYETGWRIVKIIIGVSIILGAQEWIKDEKKSVVELDDHLID